MRKLTTRIPEWAAKILLALVAFSLLVFLIQLAGLDQLKEAFASVSLQAVLTGFLFYVLTCVFRAARFKALLRTALLGTDIRLRRIFSVAAAQAFINDFIPFRVGELSYLYWLKKEAPGTRVTSLIPSLVISRVFDLWAVSLLFMIAWSQTMWTMPKELNVLGHILALSVLVIWLLMFVIWKLRAKVRVFGKAVTRHSGLSSYRLVQWLMEQMREVAQGFEIMSSARVLILTGFYSLLIWLSLACMNLVLWRAMGIRFSLPVLIFVCMFLNLSSFVPIHSVGGLGTQDAVWTYLVINLGYSLDRAIVAGLSAHIIAMLYVVVIGGYSLFALRFLQGHFNFNSRSISEEEN